MFNWIPRFIFTLAAALISNTLTAQDKPVDGALAVHRMPVSDKHTARTLIGKLSPIVGQFARAHSMVSPDYPFDVRRSDNWVTYDTHFLDFELTNTKFANAETLYTITFDSKNYIAGIGSYVPVLKATPDCGPAEADGTNYCRRIAENNLVCHLFLFDPQTHAVIAVGAMPIERDNRAMPGVKKRSWVHFDPKYPNDPRQMEGWPRCHVVSAVGSARVIPNALLITLHYIDSAESISKYGKDQQNFYTTTALLRFSTDELGNVQIKQDQSCLGNPNTITSISAARKVLAACEAASVRRDERR